MNFDEIDHLPYRHSQFVPSISMEVLQINSFFLIDFAASSCFSDVLHDILVPIFWDIPLVGGFFIPSLGSYLFLGEGFSHEVFPLSLFLKVSFLMHLYMGT